MDRDPTPGDPSRVKALSIQLHDFADDVESALRLVKGMQSEDAILAWAGLSADAFRDEFGSAPKNLDKLHTSYRLAADALEAYWPDLEHAQYQADRALSDGRTAHAQLTSAQSGLSGAQDWVHTATSTADTYDPSKHPGASVPPPDSDKVRQSTRDLAAAKARQAHAQQAVTSAQSALDAAKRLAEQARSMREDAARRTVTKLHEASDAGIKNRHWWEKAVHWVADHWDEIVTVCRWIVAILGIVVMILGGPLAWLVVAAALIVLADTVSQYIQGKASLWAVLFAALDCIPMTKGLTSLGRLSELYKAGGLLRIGAESVKSMSAGLKTMAAAFRALGEIPSALRAGRQGFTAVDRVLQTGGELRRVRGDADFFTEWADDAYDSIRATDDVGSVAATAAEHGFTPMDIQQIKDHLFNEEHLLDSYGHASVARFDANPRIAEAWIRLKNGSPHPADIDLLRHELHESNYMRETGSQSYQAAHRATIDAGHTWDPAAAARDGFGRRPSAEE
ncbi:MULTISPECIES: putative T7SS-secreted protein [unclassified Streptomyces]|uniref:putative T7SS-secreted protein n=1 Tax=unclassified Streptomyces TaxID=2593676 RepID=UPI002E27CE6B|nr:hypothetical protein [Streptomyces sp. NBC_00223]